MRYVKISLLLVLILGYGLMGAGAEQVHLGWSTNDVYHTMTVCWWTPEKTGPNTVFYGTTSREDVNYDKNIKGRKYQIAPDRDIFGEGIETEFDGWYHQANIKNLEPGKTYYFRIGTPSNAGEYTREWKFQTISRDERVRMVIGGDSRRPYSPEEIKHSPACISNWPWARNAVTEGAAKENPDCVVFLGDMVTTGKDQSQWTNWLNSFQERLVTEDGRMIPIIPVIGNHEMGAHPQIESTYEWFKGIFPTPKGKAYFSMDFPNVHLAVLATTGGGISTSWEGIQKEMKEQKEWLKKDLQNNDSRFKIAAFHIPYYSGYYSGSGDAREFILKEFSSILEDKKSGVNLVVNGHVHSYLRTYPLKTVDVKKKRIDKEDTKYGYKPIYEMKKDSREGVTYIIQGCWGAPIHAYVKGGPQRIREYSASARALPSFTLLEFTSDRIEGVTKSISDQKVDEFEIPTTIQEFTTPEYNFRH